MDKYIGRSPQELAEELYIPAPLKNFTNHF